jgi:hypothetical protein
MLLLELQVTGKAMMLDEIINYVQSLQRQVEVSRTFLLLLLDLLLLFLLGFCTSVLNSKGISLAVARKKLLQQ